MRKSSEAELKASAKYDKANTKSLFLKLNIHTDADILEHLASLDNKQGYIKELIRKDMNEPKLVEKRILEGNFTEGEYVKVIINGEEYRRKVRYSATWGDLIVRVNNQEHAKYEFK